MSAKPIRPDRDPFSALDFEWKARVAGYEWRGGTLHRLDFPAYQRVAYYTVDPLAKALTPKAGGADRSYKPLSVPELFRTFARTPPTEAGILNFAEQYGQLGSGHATFQKVGPPTRARKSTPEIVGSGELYQVWVYEIARMNQMISVWECLKTGGGNGLLNLVMRWSERDEKVAAYCRARGWKVADGDGWLIVDRGHDGVPNEVVFDPDGGRPPVEGNRTRIAWEELEWTVNARVMDHCKPVMCASDDPVPRFALRVIPRTLLGALWWGLARAITGEASFQKCSVCPRNMEISRDRGSRADRMYCSPKCKFKGHRLKVAEAKAMRARGSSLIEIATRFQTKMSTVKRWLAPKK
jgi:hypothetical protein